VIKKLSFVILVVQENAQILQSIGLQISLRSPLCAFVLCIFTYLQLLFSSAMAPLPSFRNKMLMSEILMMIVSHFVGLGMSTQMSSGRR